jgi:tape measure domain-containing protein
VNADTSGLQSGMQKATKEMSGFTARANTTMSQIQMASRAASAAVGAAIAAGAVQAAAGILRTADEMKGLSARINLISNGTADAIRTMTALRNTALTTGVELGVTIDTFQRLNSAKSLLGATDEQLLKLTDTALKLGAIGGSSADSLNNAIVQLAQGMAGVKFEAEEFNSIQDQAPEIINAIARGMKITTGELIKMKKEGQILTKDVFDALMSQVDETNDRFKQIPPTMDRVRNAGNIAWQSFIADVDTTTNATNTLIAEIISVAKELQPLMPIIRSVTIFAVEQIKAIWFGFRAFIQSTIALSGSLVENFGRVFKQISEMYNNTIGKIPLVPSIGGDVMGFLDAAINNGKNVRQAGWTGAQESFGNFGNAIQNSYTPATYAYKTPKDERKAMMGGINAPVTGRFGEARGATAKSKAHAHSGIDYAMPVGTPIYATRTGKIASAGAAGNYGNMVKMAVGDGVEMLFAHLRNAVVKQGDVVQKGQLLGYSGNTGNSSGPHLHFETRKNGTAINPDTLQYNQYKQEADGMTQASEAAMKRREALMERGKELTESLRTAQEVYNAKMLEYNSLLKSGDISQQAYARATAEAKAELFEANPVFQHAKEIIEATKTPLDQYNEAVKAATEAHDKGYISTERFTTHLAALKKELQESDEEYKRLMQIADTAKDTLADPVNVYIQHLQDLQKLNEMGVFSLQEIKRLSVDAYKELKDGYEPLKKQKEEMLAFQGVVQNWGSAFENTFIDSLKTGRFEFKAFIASMLEDLARITLKLYVIQPLLQKLFNPTATPELPQGGLPPAPEGYVPENPLERFMQFIGPAKERTEQLRTSLAGVKTAIGDAFVTSAEEAEGSWVNLIKNLIKELGKLAVKLVTIFVLKQITGFATGSGGGGGGDPLASAGLAAANLVGSIAGYASGGRPKLNTPAWVGEHGPELFVPDTQGRIIPNLQSQNLMRGGASSQPVVQHITINATDANSFKQMLKNESSLIGQFGLNAVTSTQRRNGQRPVTSGGRV